MGKVIDLFRRPGNDEIDGAEMLDFQPLPFIPVETPSYTVRVEELQRSALAFQSALGKNIVEHIDWQTQLDRRAAELQVGSFASQPTPSPEVVTQLPQQPPAPTEVYLDAVA